MMVATGTIGRARFGTARLAMWLTFAAMLVLPWLAMHFTAEVAWDGADFAAAAILLLAVGLAVEAACRLIAHPLSRAAAVAAALGLGALLWAEAAVGVF